MIGNQKVVVVLPAYNAEKTLRQTVQEIDTKIVDEIILVDDASTDNTSTISEELGLNTVIHPINKGYGGNQKTCYQYALNMNADIVIMLHPDYQYTPKLIPSMAYLIHSGLYDIVLGSRILPIGALKGGMPMYKYIGNRFLTFFENILLKHKLSEFHTGYRAFHRRIFDKLPIMENSDDFVFDNQILAQAIYFNLKIGEISCPTRYIKEASSINFISGLKYAFGVVCTAICFRLQKLGLFHFSIFNAFGRKLSTRKTDH